MKKPIAVLAGVLALSSLVGAAALPAKQEIFAVSFYEVLARPAEYERKPIVVAGIISLEFEDTALYPEIGSYRTGWRPDAIDLVLSREQEKSLRAYHGKRVLVQGTFERVAPHSTELGPFGRLRNVVRVRPIEERAPLEKR